MKLKEKTKKIVEILFEGNKNPKIELDYVNNFTLMVAVVLSARNTDVGVNKATKELFKKYDSPYKMIELGEDGLREYIKTIGLYKTKAKNIIATSKILVEEYSGALPNSFDELIELPGVGRKSANVILNTAFDHPRIGVDTHVFRVSRRLGLANGNTPEKVENELMALMDEDMLKNGAHHLFVLHGRYVCKSQKPKCGECKISNYCDFFNYKTI
jgi:endonuclease III